MFTPEEMAIIAEAKAIYTAKFKSGDSYTESKQTKTFCQLALAHHEQEVFGVLFLDNQHRLIVFKEMFFGTIDAASVYPREVVKTALAHNAAAVIFTHNHPSGCPKPSVSDKRITMRLKDALDTVDIRVLDHIVVGVEGTCSMVEMGWLL